MTAGVASVQLEAGCVRPNYGDMDRIAMSQSRILPTLLLVGLIACWPTSTPRAQTAPDVFQVSGIPVDVTAADAVAAREQALRQGQLEGLRRLLRRLVPADQHARLPAVGPAEIQRYVRNFEIAEERVAADRYLAELTVSYQPDAVRGLLQGQGLSYAETPSEPLVVLPVYHAPDGPRLWPDDNPWWQAWSEHLDTERLLRLVLPLGDLEDMAKLTAERALAGDTAALEALAQRYGTTDVLVVIATPRGRAAAQAEEAAPSAPPALQLEVRRDGIQGNPPETVEGQPGQTLEDLMAEAVTGLQDTLDERWKEGNLLRYDQAGSILVEIPIDRLADWVEISRGIEGLTEIVGIEVDSFARDNVRAHIRYLGDEFRLEEALGRIGLTLSREGEPWRLLRMGASRSPGGAVSATSRPS
ncbi:MAG TPA: DUF2066 domain-containing protein [Geminicoccaceae bacterium]|nr:DUF2066 domain-containing protein [Geminicoccaceae bacterium]